MTSKLKPSFLSSIESNPDPNPMVNLPPWLQSYYNPRHIRTALAVLAEREDIRIGLCQFQSVHRHNGHNHSESRSPSLSKRPAADNCSTDPDSFYYSVYTGSLPENQHRNRYVDILPYDRTRVRVRVGEAQGNSEEREGEYLNANWVREKFGGKWWIASQAPLKHTAYTFLSLLLHNIESPGPNPSSSPPRTIVQLTQNMENGRRKAHSYFPDTVGETIVHLPDTDTISAWKTNLKVTLLKQENVPGARCVKSTVSVVRVVGGEYGEEATPASSSSSSSSHSSPTTIFTHLLFSAWPDHSVPTPADRAALIEFIRLVDRVNQVPASNHNLNPSSNSDPPIIVNCSAGVGRTGSFIAMNSLLRFGGFFSGHAKHNERSGSRSILPSDTSIVSSMPITTLMPPLPSSISGDFIAQEIDSLRDQRPGMVQRPEQAVLVYEVVAEVYGGG